MINPDFKEKKTGNSFLTVIRKIFSTQEVIIVLPIIVLIGIAVAFNPNFLNPMNLVTIGTRMSQWGFIAIGEALIIMTGNFDISVGQMAALINVFFTISLVSWGLPLGIAIILSILLGALISTISGLIIVKLKVNAFITTIAMLFILRGLSKAINYARPVPITSLEGVEGFLRFGQARPLNLSWSFFIFIALIIIFQIILKKSAYGRKIYATGDSNNVARMAGINTDLIKISAFTISGTLVGLASVLLISKEAVGNPNYGSGWELFVIAAVAIGGVSLMGGAGSMIGVIIGVIIMQIISNILILLQINQHMQSVVLGTVIILATVLDIKQRNRILGKID